MRAFLALGLSFGFALATTLGLSIGSSLTGCDQAEVAPPTPRPPPPEPPPVRTPDEVWLPLADSDRAGPYVIRPDFSSDLDYADRELVEARRIIYRFKVRVPPVLGAGIDTMPPTASELRFLVTPDRLRATFVGTGWPVHADSQVRVRRDQPGTYVFDGRGGRPLGPGQMAQWFDGGPPRRHVRVWLRVDEARDEADVGHMVCRFLAEWASASVDALTQQCADGVPRWIRIGPYVADRTADVTVFVPRERLRSDHELPPARVAGPPAQRFHPKPLYRRMHPKERPPSRAHDAPISTETTGLLVHNGGRTRMVVTLDGTSLGSVDVDASVEFPDVPPGVYMVGGMRPLGGLAARAKLVRIPGVVTLP